MKPGYVGTRSVSSQPELASLLQAHASEEGWYFLRWSHGVSGFQSSLPSKFEFAEGQLFTDDRELRWKPHRQGFNLLLLSTQDAKNFDQLKVGFQAIAGNWIAQDWNASVYPPDETRLPKGVTHNGVDVGQRYFIDKTTWIIHFIGLVARGGK